MDSTDAMDGIKVSSEAAAAAGGEPVANLEATDSQGKVTKQAADSSYIAPGEASATGGMAANGDHVEETGQLKDANGSSQLFRAPIKKEFWSTYQEVRKLLDDSHIRKSVEESRSQQIKDDQPSSKSNHIVFNDDDDDDEAASLNDDTEPSSPERKKSRGQNKHRPRKTGVQKQDRLCHATKDGRECTNVGQCLFSHDVEKFLKSKPPDLGEECPIFQKFGICKYGLTCRFSGSHGKVEPGKLDQPWENPDVHNRLDFVDRKNLRQKRYDFDRTLDILESFGYHYQSGKVRRQKPARKDVARKDSKQLNSSAGDDVTKPTSGDDVTKTTSDDDVTKTTSGDDVTKTTSGDEITKTTSGDEITKTTSGDDVTGTTMHAGAVTDEDVIASRPDEQPEPVTLAGKRYLAPLTTLGNLPFRRLCVDFGAEVTCGEMAVTTSLLQASVSEWPLVMRHSSEKCFGVQLCGSHPDTFCLATQILTDRMAVDFIDINMGCPIDLVCSKGGGCMMMRNEKRLGQCCRAMKSLMGTTPLTVKMRTGIQSGHLTAHKLIPQLKEWGVSLFTLHGRTKEQRYTRLPDWEYIEKCGLIGQSVGLPCVGCGDVLSWQDYYAQMERPGISGVMLARGALIKPWLFTEIAERRDWDISASERLDMLRRFTNFGLEHWGSDDLGVAKTRRFLLEWLSFLHRYIPSGLLERLPQRINERPPFYRGRSDLETLFGSPDCADWVTISEMLLGPVQDGFQFLPKHKANSF